MKFNDKVYYGWILVFVLFIAYLTMAGISTYGTSIITTKMVLESGFSESIIGYSASALFAAYAIGSIPASYIIERCGYRFTFILGGIICLLGYICLFFNHSSSFLYVVLFAVLGFGGLLGGQVTAPAVINSWFNRNKAMPMAIVLSAGAIGGFIMPIFANQICNTENWNYCWIWYAVFVLISLVFIMILIKESPEEIGEIKDGYRWTKAHPLAANHKCELIDNEEISIKEVYHSRAFIILCIVVIWARATLSSCSSYLLLYATQVGLDSNTAVFSISLFSATGLVGRFAASMVDKLPFPLHKTNALCFLIMGIGGIMLAMAFFSAGLVSVAVGIIGFGNGVINTLIPLLPSAYFGQRKYSVIYGTLNALGCIGSTAGPLVVQALSGLLGGFQFSYFILGLGNCLCAILAFITPVRTSRYASV